MKAKLASLVKIAKQKLQEEERMLARNQILIARKREQIDCINAQIAAIPIPTAGNFSLYQNQKAGIQAYLYEIEEIQKQIALLLKEQEMIRQNMRLAHLNHEKMLHVYNQEKEKQENYLKTLENKQLDENTLILHSRTKRDYSRS
ncbi:flagellar FliJ family protein [Helicobacter sp. MIT 14-3879]|uniref:flagellar FliJ family protein n=1 Tax=Helicobacter sp. MIT 14-3879 TaxID=2040649 RepID=UPI000E1E463A|nr:flagellar FliJ family protein [Helicobacter sp. MIT 14-3879]RDU59964.1 hypothetical protein CQA44_11020 [Helicobacter sp. MIT 14-3879]